MGRFLLLFIAFLCPYTQAIQCNTPNDPKVRLFDSIPHYQANKVPFSPLSPGWQGSNVEFSFLTVKKLEKNTFITYDCQAVISLKLSGKRIQNIDEGAFNSLICLHQLLLDNNNITKLEKNFFSDLQRLEKLDLSYNKIEVIEDFVFSNLVRLKILNLGNNQIEKLQNKAFENLTKLEDLYLDHNEISKISPDLFLPLVSLNNLSLAWNMLRAEPETWLGLKDLHFLDLASNNLDHFDPSYNFSFFTLRSLNLSLNSLTQLNVIEIKRHLPQLKLIDLNGNSWFCDDLERIIHDLNDSGIKLPARNFTSVGVHGIACSEVPVYSTSTTTEKLKTTRQPEIWVRKDELEKKIRESNEEIGNEITTLRSFVIFVFALVCLFILFEILFRIDCCRNVIGRFRGGNELYYDNSNVENFRLLGR